MEVPVPTHRIVALQYPRSAVIVFVGILVGWWSFPGAGRAQTTLDAEGACTTCISIQIESTLVDSTGQAPSPGLAGQNDQGEIFLVPTYNRASVQVYSSTGGQTRGFGRTGEGPGEFQNIRHIEFGPADSIYLFDSRQRRLTVLSSDFELGRTVPLPGSPLDALIRDDGVVVLNSPIYTPAKTGIPFHLLQANGGIIRSFGANSAEPFYGEPLAIAFVLQPGSEGHFWAIGRTTYRIEDWTIAGQMEREFVRSAPWFDGGRFAVPISPEDPPATIVKDFVVDDHGRLRVLVSVPAENWRAALESYRGADGEEYWRVKDVQTLLRSRLEIIDPTSGRVLASQILPSLVGQFLGPDQIIDYKESPVGIPEVDILRIRVSGLEER